VLRPLNEIKQLWHEVNINKQPEPIVHCVDCGQYIVHNHVMIQRHYVEKHNAEQHLEKGFRFNPVRLK